METFETFRRRPGQNKEGAAEGSAEVAFAPILEARGLTKRFDGFALDGVDLTVAPGEVVGLVGSNGAGKTTTLKLALGLDDPDAGSVSLLGLSGDAWQDGRAADTAKAQVGVVFDTCPFPAAYQVRDVRTVGHAAYAAWDDELWMRLIERFALPEKRAVAKLSRGMGMKLSLAFALAHRPRLLVLDEATAGLDPAARQEVLEMLRDFMAESDDGNAILMSTHITSDLDRIADRVVGIDAGRLLFTLPLDAMTDMAGIARLTPEQLDAVRASKIYPSGAERTGEAPERRGSVRPRIVRHPYHVDLLVPDRLAFAHAFPDVPVDRTDVEGFLLMTLEGETL